MVYVAGVLYVRGYPFLSQIKPIDYFVHKNIGIVPICHDLRTLDDPLTLSKPTETAALLNVVLVI